MHRLDMSVWELPGTMKSTDGTAIIGVQFTLSACRTDFAGRPMEGFLRKIR